MTFEEFFQKKRIDLTRLQAGEPALFFEFKAHFEQMGEKSFDHTKKYWFNKLRLLYHLAPEQKPEKMHLENRLAEQTIVETLTDSIPKRKPGFTPRFNSGATDTNSDGTLAAKTESEKAVIEDETSKVNEPAQTETTTPKPGFKPRFNPKMVAPKSAEETESIEPKAESKEIQAEVSAEVTAPKPAFKPRFNMKMAAPKPAEEAESTDEAPASPIENTAPKPGFKPRFNMKMAAPKSAEPVEDKVEESEQTATTGPMEEEPNAEAPAEATTPKPGFKPRFNMKMVAPKPAEEETAKPEMIEPATEKPVEPDTENPVAQNAPADESTPKPVGFKPRFNAAKMKPKPPQE
jgi:hypothetical protein